MSERPARRPIPFPGTRNSTKPVPRGSFKRGLGLTQSLAKHGPKPGARRLLSLDRN